MQDAGCGIRKRDTGCTMRDAGYETLATTILHLATCIECAAYLDRCPIFFLPLPFASGRFFADMDFMIVCPLMI